MPIVMPQDLSNLVQQVFVTVGVPQLEAGLVAAHLVEAELAGVTSHGVLRVPQYVRAVEERRIAADARLSVMKESPSTAVLDGGRGFGQVMVRQAMDRAVGIADRTGVGVVTLVNCSHTGRLGSYTEYAARQGKIGIALVNAGGHGQWVAPFGGTAGRLSTNPISIGIPSGDSFPLVLDIATSAAPEGKIRAMFAASKPVPEGWLVTHDGRSTTSPVDLYGPPRGALLPFGGHKGFGLAMMIDALAGGLSGAGCCHQVDAPMEGKTDGVLLIAIAVEAFLPLTSFAEQVRELIRHVKSSPPAAGFDKIVVPGEIESTQKEMGTRNGIALTDAVWRDLLAIRDRLGIATMT